MQNFLSTLVQLSGTLLSIFFAAVTAYYVFLQDRSAHFREEIEHAKLEIRDSLIQIRSRWPWTLTMYLPPEFKDTLRSKYSSMSFTDFVSQAAVDLIFHNKEIVEAISEQKHRDTFGGSVNGRIYFLILTDAVNAITVGSPDTRTKPAGVYPSSPQGPGFDEWRKDFEKLQGPLQLMSDFQRNMSADFKQFVDGLSSDRPKAMLQELFNREVGNLFTNVGTIRTLLNKIDKQELLAKTYSFSNRVHLLSILILTGIAILLGIILPLALLTLPKEITPTVGLVLLFTTLVSLGGGVTQFVWDISRPIGFDEKAYLSARWYSFLLKEMETQKIKLENGGLVDIEFFIDAHNTTDRNHFPDEVIQTLDEFVTHARTYNEKAQRFNDAFFHSIATDKVIGPHVAKYKSLKGGPVFYPYYCLQEDDQWRLHLDRFLKDLHSDISIEILMPRWTHVRYKIPGSAFTADPSKLSMSLNSIRSSVRTTEAAREFLAAKTAFETSSKKLQGALTKAMK